MVMKKIVLIVPSLIKGGAERVVSILSKELSKYFEVYVVIYHGPVEYEIEGKLINLETPTGNLWKKIKNTFLRVIKLKKLIRNISPDYIVSFMGNLQPILTLNPVIVSFHIDPDFSLLYKKCLLKTIYKLPNVKKIITVSKGIEKKLNNNYHLKKTKTIYNPIDLKLIKQKLLTQKPVDFDYILAVGRLSRQKGFDILINAFAKSDLKNKGKLIILGEGKERNNLEKLIDGLDLKSQVLLYGKVDNPFIYMKYANFFVLSSRYEGLPMVLLEALACGTPVIAANCESGPSEIIENEKNGLLIPVEDEKALKDAMEKLFHDRGLYDKLKANSSKSVEKFAVENIVKDWINLFQEIGNS
jgi:N-acetylgalactosamine-N,N'-diacetylbacillosaminyl-diphospho-undecaprenol 4-alpha-N-acetylgalactosaminyltransferase